MGTPSNAGNTTSSKRGQAQFVHGARLHDPTAIPLQGTRPIDSRSIHGNARWRSVKPRPSGGHLGSSTEEPPDHLFAHDDEQPDEEEGVGPTCDDEPDDGAPQLCDSSSDEETVVPTDFEGCSTLEHRAIISELIKGDGSTK